MDVQALIRAALASQAGSNLLRATQNNQASPEGIATLQASGLGSALNANGSIDWNNPALAYQIAQNPFLASSLTQSSYSASPAATAAAAARPDLDPDVLDLGEHFNLDARMMEKLDKALKQRPTTAEGDMAALWEILENARNPSALLQSKIQEMEANTFIGKVEIDKDTKKLQKMYQLDDDATQKLAEAMARRETTRDSDLEQLHRHLETSNKPSARIMLLLKSLRSGEPLPEPDKRVAPGSYLDRKKKQQEADKAKKSRSRSRQNQRVSSRDRGGRDDRGRGGSDRDRRSRDRGRDDRDRRDRSRDRRR